MRLNEEYICHVCDEVSRVERARGHLGAALLLLDRWVMRVNVRRILWGCLKRRASSRSASCAAYFTLIHLAERP